MGGMGLREIGEKLPPGFRFYPSDEELVCHYLYKKVSYSNSDQLDLDLTLVDIDLHVCEPWQLPDVAKLNSNEWYFFSFRDRKYATGFRTNRATTSGYWKATGKDRPVFDPRTKSVVGMRKTLVFYKNRAPNGIKTAWIMHRAGRLGSVRVFYKSRSENPNTAENESTSSLNHLGLNCAPAAYQNHCSTSQTAGKLQLEDDYRSFLFDFDASNDIISSSLFI